MVQVIAGMLGWKPAPPSDLPGDDESVPPLDISAVFGADLGMPAPIFNLDEIRERNRARALEIARRNMARAG